MTDGTTMRGQGIRVVMAAVWLATLPQLVLADAAAAADGSLGRAVFKDAHDPPSWQALDAAARARYDFGHAVFNTHWLPAGTRDAARIDGVGPLYNAGACDSCHNEGARGRGPLADGSVGGSLVVQLETPGASSAAPDLNSGYGHVLNTAAIDGLAPEATVTVRYQARSGRYADGAAWQLRAPQDTVTDLRYGALDASTVLKPRLAPPLFGAGLLEAVPDDAILATAPRGRTIAAGARSVASAGRVARCRCATRPARHSRARWAWARATSRPTTARRPSATAGRSRTAVSRK